MTVAATLPAGVGLADLLRDTRHLGARAASDLADWLAYLAVEGKADRTLYAYYGRVTVEDVAAKIAETTGL